MTGTLRIVTLPGKQVKQAKLREWERENGVKIVRQGQLLSRSPLTVSVYVVPASPS